MISGDRLLLFSELVEEFSNIEVNKTTAKNGDSGYEYIIRDNNGKIISELKYYDYNIKNFDWVLLSDVKTDKMYRGKGLATKLINKMYSDINKPNPKKGVYLFVKENNINAISLYKKLGFKFIKEYTLKDGNYLIMAKGNGDIKQIENMKFS